MTSASGSQAAALIVARVVGAQVVQVEFIVHCRRDGHQPPGGWRSDLRGKT